MKLTTTTQVSVDGGTIQVYRPAGRPQYATAIADLKR